MKLKNKSKNRNSDRSNEHRANTNDQRNEAWKGYYGGNPKNSPDLDQYRRLKMVDAYKFVSKD